MYGCLTHCLGPGCDYWQVCERECASVRGLCPRSTIMHDDLPEGMEHVCKEYGATQLYKQNIA